MRYEMKATRSFVLVVILFLFSLYNGQLVLLIITRQAEDWRLFSCDGENLHEMMSPLLFLFFLCCCCLVTRAVINFLTFLMSEERIQGQDLGAFTTLQSSLWPQLLINFPSSELLMMMEAQGNVEAEERFWEHSSIDILTICCTKFQQTHCAILCISHREE